MLGFLIPDVVKRWAIYVGLIALAVLSIYLYGRRSAQTDQLLERAKHVRVAKELKDEIESAGDQRRKELNQKWTR